MSRRGILGFFAALVAGCRAKKPDSENNAGIFILQSAQITGGYLGVDPAYHRFDTCLFREVEVNLRRPARRDRPLFKDCAFVDCKLDPDMVQQSSVNTRIENSPVSASGEKP